MDTSTTTRTNRARLLRRTAAFAVLAGLAVGAALPAAAHAQVGIERTSSASFYVDSSTFADTFPKIRANYVSYAITNDGAARADVWVAIDDFTGSTVSLAPNESPLVHMGAMAPGASRTAFFYLQSSASSGSGSHTIRVYEGRPADGGVELASGTFSLTVSNQGFNNANKVSSVSISPASPSLGGLVVVTVNGETGTIGNATILSFTPASDVGFPAKAFQLESTRIAFSQSGCPTTGKNCATVVDRLLVPPSVMPSSQNTQYVATYTFRATNVTTQTTAISPLAYISSGQSPSHTSTGSFSSLPPVQPVDNTLTLAKAADRSLANATLAGRTVTYTVTVSNASAFGVSFDDLVDTIPAGAAYVPGSATWGGDPLPDPSLAAGRLSFVAPFSVPGASNRELAYRLVLAASDGVAANRVVGHSGETQIDTTLATTDDAPAEASVLVDATPPSLAITSHPPERTNGTSAAFVFSADELSTFECLAPGSEVWGPCESGVTFDGLTEGEQRFSVRATDLAGNDATETFVWAVDLTPPAVTVSGPPATTASHEAEFTFSADESVSFFCTLDDGEEAPCASPLVLADVGNGLHTLTVRAVDAAGNEAVETYAWTVDGAPLVQFDATPPATTNATTATFAFSADRPDSTYECSLDGGEWAACASPFEVSGLGAGPHALAVRATAAAGTGEARSYAWTVDLVAPSVTIESGPSSPVASRVNVFEFAADEPATFACRWSWDDEGDFWPCASGDALDSGRDGSFALQVRATDAAGNVGAAAEWPVTVDTEPPAVLLTSAPADPTADPGATFEFSAEEPVAFSCSLDGGAFASCSEPGVLTGSESVSALAPGPHTFAVRATDLAGNTGEPATHGWTVLGAPAVAFDETPPTVTRGVTDTFRFSAIPAVDGTAFECSLDGGEWAACASPLELDELAEGERTLAVRASNAFGTGEPSMHGWTVDRTPPAVELTAAPPALTSLATATFGFAADDEGAAFECSLDGGDFEPCASPLELVVGDGSHTLLVRASDAAGNVSDPVAHEWTVDTQAPSLSLDEAPPELTTFSEATFAFGSDDEGAAFECALDPGTEEPEYEPCPTPYVLDLPDGTHRLFVRARDAAGNASAALSHRWTIDTVAPLAGFESGPDAETTETTAVLAFAADDDEAAFECSLDGAAWAECESPLELEGLAPGPHTLLVRASDPAGNVGPPTTWSWTVVAEEEPPAPVAALASITAGPIGETTETAATFAFTADQGEVTFECSLDDGAFEPCESPLELTGLALGERTFRVRAVNGAGPGAADERVWTVVAATPGAAHLALAVASAPSVLVVGRDAAVVFEVANVGASAAAGTVLSALAPPGLAFRSAGSTAGSGTACERARGRATCVLGELAPAAEATLTLVVRASRPGPFTIVATASSDSVPEAVEAALERRASRCTIMGTPGNDLLVGTPGRDVICGRDGSDVIRGGGGNDVVNGGAGDDRISGGPGRDLVRAGPGNDLIRGDGGADRLFGGGGNDTLDGGRGNDRIYGGRGRDLIWGRAGRDIFSGGPGRDVIHSHDGEADRVFGGPGRDLWLGDRLDRATAVEIRRLVG